MCANNVDKYYDQETQFILVFKAALQIEKNISYFMNYFLLARQGQVKHIYLSKLDHHWFR